MAEAALLERRSAPDRGVGTRASNSPAVPANVPIATWPTSSFAGTVRYSSFAVRDHERRGIVLALARVEQDLREQLERTGLVTHIGPDRLFATLPVALDAFLPPLAVRTPAISESRLYI